MNIINSNSFQYNYEEEKAVFVFSNLKQIKKFVTISPQEILNLILNKQKIPYDILIFDLIDSKDFYCHLIFNLLKDCKKIKLVVYNHYLTLPFKVEKKNIKDEIIKKEDIKINFHHQNYKIKDRFLLLNDLKETLLKNKKNKKILVIVPGESESLYLYKNLKQERKEKLGIYILNDKYNKNIKKEKEIYIMEANNMIPIFDKDIEIIYDCYMKSFNKLKINYLNKQHLELLKTYLYQGEINLMITEEFFNNSPIIGIPIIPYYDLYKYYLLLVKNNLNIKNIFKNIIMEEKLNEIKDILINLNLINENRVMVDIDKLFSFNLSLRPSLILYNSLKNNNNIYPFVVLASIIENVKYIFDKIEIPDPLVFYLEKWLEFSKEFQDLDIEKFKLKTWTEKNELNFYNFLNILEKVKEILDVINNKYDLEIGLFNINILLEKAKPYLEISFKDYNYHLKDKKEYIYTNNYHLSKIKLYTEYKYPEKVISFFQKRNNYKDELDEIIFYTIINY